MKNLKRTLSLVLAVALCFSLLTMGASAKTYKDDSSITYKEAVQWLTSLGVMNGELNSDGTYSLRPTDPITRAEYAKLICFVLNGGSDPAFGSTTSTSFKDTVGHWAAGYIEALVASGYTAGYGDGTFGPEDTITGQQAAKIMLTVMGYNAQYEGLVGPTWASKADALAGQKGLYKELVSFKSSNLLTREQAAQIIWNALQKKTLSYAEAGTLGNKVVEGDKTLLTFYFDGITTCEGVLLANSYGSIDGSVPQAGKIKVQLWKTNKVITLNSDPTTAAMLGQSVRFAYKDKVLAGSADYALIGDLATTEYNKTYTTTTGNSIKQATVGFDLDTDYSKSTASKIQDNAATIVINNAIVSDYDTYAGLLKYSAPSTDDVYVNGWGFQTTFIDNNGDGICDYIITYAARPYYVVDVTSTQATLKDMTDNSTTITVDLAKSYNFADNSKATIVDDTYLLGYVANNRLYVMDSSSFSGKVSGIKQTSAGGQIYFTLTIDGTAYTLRDAAAYGDGSMKAAEKMVDPDPSNSPSVTVNTSATFYKDSNGYIFYIDDTKGGEGAVDFAYITSADDAYNFSAKGQYAEVIYEDGTKGTVLVKQYSDASKKLDDISGHPLDDGDVIAYVKNSDGSLNVYKTAVTAKGSVTGYKLDNDMPRIETATSGTYLKNVSGAEYFTSSATKFVNVASKKAYVGYSNVPDITFGSSSDLFIVTQEESFLARKELLGGTTAGADDYVTTLFYTGASLTADSDAIWFTIQNVKSYSQSYVDSKLVKEYKAVVNGEIQQIKILENKTSGLANDTLYKIKDYAADGTTVSEIDATSVTMIGKDASNNDVYTTAGGKIKLVDSGILTIDQAGTNVTYTLTSSTKYIDLTTGSDSITNFKELSKGYTIFVNQDAKTKEALQVYILNKK